jgi:menaquinone-dependent protoporphyrinogen oxidase
MTQGESAMKPILVLYATREGQTRRIAEHIAESIRAHGRESQLAEVATAQEPALTDYGAVILAASVHLGKHEREMVQFVREHRDALQKLPTVFLSTSMAEAAAEQGPESRRDQAHAEAEQRIEEFFAATGFRTNLYKAVAGALLYTQYNWLVRLVMKQISKSEGVSTDTSRDYEYTDWVDLDRFIDGLLKGQLFERTALATSSL